MNEVLFKLSSSFSFSTLHLILKSTLSFIASISSSKSLTFWLTDIFSSLRSCTDSSIEFWLLKMKYYFKKLIFLNFSNKIYTESLITFLNFKVMACKSLLIFSLLFLNSLFSSSASFFSIFVFACCSSISLDNLIKSNLRLE